MSTNFAQRMRKAHLLIAGRDRQLSRKQPTFVATTFSARRLVSQATRKKCGSSLLQRRLRIGYGRAAHLIDFMENDGIVGAADGPKPREVLKRPDWITEMEQSLR